MKLTRMTTLLLLVSLAIVLCGCMEPDVTPMPTPSPTPMPVAEDSPSFPLAVGYTVIVDQGGETVTGFVDVHGVIHYA